MADRTKLHGVILSVLSERWELSTTLPTAKVKMSLFSNSLKKCVLIILFHFSQKS